MKTKILGIVTQGTRGVICGLLLGLFCCSGVLARETHHYVFFAFSRERIAEASFISTKAFEGAQLKYSWRELEPKKDEYDFSAIRHDLAFLSSRGKKLFIQLQDVSFNPLSVLVPEYLRSEEYDDGVAAQYKIINGDEEHATIEGWVARRWNPAVQDRFHKLLVALGREFDGKIEGLNFAETAADFAETGRLAPKGFTNELYRDAIITNMKALKRAFPRSVVMQYANFMPGEWLPGEDKSYLRSVYKAARELGVGVGGPDLLPYRRWQLNHSYPLIRESSGLVPVGIAVQDGNYDDKNPASGKRAAIGELLQFATANLKVDYIFWCTEEPYYSDELIPFLSKQESAPSPIDVLHYSVTVEPDIANKKLTGNVLIRFVANADQLNVVEFDCGDLTIDSVRLAGAALQFSTRDHRLRIDMPLANNAREARDIEIDYHGAPKRGIRFFPDRNQVYTVFSTSQWMVCVDAPDDKATLTLKLILPASVTPVASGRFVSQRELPNMKRVSEWNESNAIPTYVFGFAAGPFRAVTEKRKGVEFRYLATNYSDTEVRRIFRDTPDMLEFFERRAGVKYAGPTYTQVLAAGGVEQEVSRFTALKESYGKQVLQNEQDQWLGAHEFAHQWWGNMVTCRDWNHFWLNEGIASFMATAYLEHRFGRAVYLREIDSYRASYEKVRLAGKDKSLVFPDWLNPTRDDRTLVYDKGAYVMHLLREEMGEPAFWNGLRIFTRRHFGKSVVTADFVAAMEEASDKDLSKFFAKWVYLEGA